MSAANPLSDSALQPVSETSDDDSEPSLPTQPWHAPPALFVDAFGTFGAEFEAELGAEFAAEFEPEFELEAGNGFDFHDTIPAPPWLDEPLDALEAPLLPAR